MNASAVPLLAIFEKKLRLEVPLFQRQYVWNKDHQWQPLWEDIERKFTEYLEGRLDAPVHFLGALVLDQKQTPVTHVERRQVIDGQQRLTTLQIFLAAFRDFCLEAEAKELAKECEGFTLNKGMMADPTTERYKVWPTQMDRKQFADVMVAGSPKAINALYPLTKRKYARKPDPRPRMIEAYLFFYDAIKEFFTGSAGEPPLAGGVDISTRLEESFQALRNSLQVVTIDLNPGDDAQVIFETLNARGEPLLPADLLRNFIFLRAGRQGENQEELYESYWKPFDDHFWRDTVRQGRLNRPRSDLFMQHFLASRQTTDIPITHLFVEYKHWIEKQHPFDSVKSELATISRQREHFRRLIAPKKDDPVFGIASFLSRFDMNTALPLLLYLMDRELPDSDWAAISRNLESYVLRRAVCGLTTKNYNRVFLGLTRALRANPGDEANSLRDYLAAFKGESTEWPDNEKFQAAWLSAHAYRTLQQPKLVHMLRRLSDAVLSTKHEDITINNPLTVEHIMPQEWVPNWPLRDGSPGMGRYERLTAPPGDDRAEATRTRDALVQTIGNLTILTQQLNSSVSNGPWSAKKSELSKYSLLPINQELQDEAAWDEASIERRGRRLLDRALNVWPRPESTIPLTPT